MRRHPLLAWTGLTIAILAAALAAGAVSGKLEHTPASHPGNSLPTLATTSTTAPPPPALRDDLVTDLSLDVQAQHSSLPSTRHALVTRAWATDQVAAVQARYDRLKRDTSVTTGQFVFSAWQAFTVTGTSATASVTGHLILVGPAGAVAQADRTWSVTLTYNGAHWLLESVS